MFLSPGLIRCRILPSQSSIKALLTNLIKCRFSNIRMNSALGYLQVKLCLQNNLNSFSSLLCRAIAWWEGRKDGSTSLSQWDSKKQEGAVLEQGKDFRSSHHKVNHTPLSPQFHECFYLLFLLQTSWSDLLWSTSASVSVEFRPGLEVKCSCLSAFLNCISRRADPPSVQVNTKVSTQPWWSQSGDY